MMNAVMLTGVTIALMTGVAATSASAQPAPRDYPAEIRAAVQAAKDAAGFEHLGLLNRLCVNPPSAGAPSTADNVPGYVANPASVPPRESWYAPPFQVFDDLHWLGGSLHSAWLLDTGEGYILIDTQFPYNSGELILDGMRALGLDPAEIRYIVISHAHGDHIGGVALVQEAAGGAPVIMGESDWDLVNAYPNRYRTMTPDVENRIAIGHDPYELTLGNKTIHIIPTPGHTQGTLSYIFTVQDFGRPVTVAYSGGTAFNFQTDVPDPGIPNLQQYIASQEMFAARAREAGATVIISNHSEFDNAYNKSRMLAGRGFGPNPFESSVDGVQRYFGVMIACAQAKVIGLEQVAAALVSQTDEEQEERWSYHDWPTGPYHVVEEWPSPLPDDRHSHDGWTWGSMGGVYAESPDRIWIAMRGELPLPEGVPPWTPYGATDVVGNATGNADGVSATCESAPLRGWERRFEHSIFVVDRQGDLVDEWPHLEELFDDPERCGRGPHQIKMSPYDPEKHVWIIDDQLHMIYKFTYDGTLAHSHGEYGVRGRGPNTFDRPTDIAWLPDGTYFITDGYGGTRVAKFDPDGNFVMDWGQPPADPQNPGPGEFNTPHSIAISEDRRLFVIDRGHERMQVFDEDGNFLDMWPLRSPHWGPGQTTLMVNHIIDQDGYIWVGDAPTNRLIQFDLDGNYLYSWGAPGRQPGRLSCSHAITTDQLGNLYLADCFAGRVQKFAPIPGSNPEHRVGQILRTWDDWTPGEVSR